MGETNRLIKRFMNFGRITKIKLLNIPKIVRVQMSIQTRKRYGNSRPFTLKSYKDYRKKSSSRCKNTRALRKSLTSKFCSRKSIYRGLQDNTSMTKPRTFRLSKERVLKLMTIDSSSWAKSYFCSTNL